MKLSNNKHVRLTLRLTCNQMDWLIEQSQSLKMSLSDFLRFIINYHIANGDKINENK